MATVNDRIVTQTVTPPGTDLDAANLQGAGPVGEDIFRERIQVAGELLAQIAKVLNTDVPVTEYGLATRAIPNLQDMQMLDIQRQILSCLHRIEEHLAEITEDYISQSEQHEQH